MDSIEIYTERIKEYTEVKNRLDVKSNLLSNIRLIVFIGGIVLAVLSFLYVDTLTGFLVSFISFAVFLFLIIRHEAVIKASKRYGSLIEINKMCYSRINGDWTNFTDKGLEYVDGRHPYSGDLDVFGHTSLYQLINCTNTFHGKENLRKLLENPDKQPEQIRKRQKAISELSGKIDFCQNLQCEGMGSPELLKDPKAILDYFENKSRLFNNTWISYVFYILPMLTLVSTAICLFDKSVSVLIPLVLLIVQSVINIIGYKAGLILKNVSTFRNKIRIYENLLNVIENENFEDQYLSQIKASFLNKGKTALKQIKSLENIVNAIDAGNNFLFYLILNVLLFWNFHCVIALESWKEHSGDLLRGWLDSIGTMEALSSLSMISQTNPEWILPEITEEKVTTAAIELGHPLIVKNKRVCNNFEMEDRICIITGSNMSGKSTLLRTIGINLVLAYAGAAVCARKFECSVMDIYTSMRINDDLNSGISTFYAELLRIKMIISSSKEQKPMIFLIDEVFRGTNSRDRYTGAKNVLLNLNKKWIIGLISTHDFDLCELEKNESGRIINYHFTEKYINNEIVFDYKVRNGRCNTTNARYLMKMVGIDFI